MNDLVKKILGTAGSIASGVASSINSPYNMYQDKEENKETEPLAGQLKDLNLNLNKDKDKEKDSKTATEEKTAESKSFSDERLKRIFGDNEDALKCFAAIDAIQFDYSDKAKEIPGSAEKGVDDDLHYGVKAQDIEANPLTESAVTKDPISDYLQIDTKELTMANTAIISEICKRILIIEKVLGIKVVKQ